jgi:hypothetical protein
MNNKNSLSINEKLSAQVWALWISLKSVISNDFGDTVKDSTQWVGSFFVLISGLILYVDKLIGYFDVSFTIPDTFAHTGWDIITFVWYISQTISPILLIIGVLLKAHKLCYLSPLYFYILQFYLVLSDFKIVDDKSFIIPSILTTFLTLAIIFLFKTASKFYVLNEIEKVKKVIKENN